MHDRGVNSTRRRLVSGGAFGLLAVIGLVMPSAFVVETAGPAIDVTGKYDGTQLVKLSGATTYSTSTKLFMTTVSSYGTADNGVPSAQVFASLFSRDMQSVPVRALYSKDESSGDVDRRNAALMTDSQDTAAVVALGKAGRTVKMKLVVAGAPKGSHAAGKLSKGDVLTSISVAGKTTKLETYSDLSRGLAKTAPGTKVTIGFTRKGEEKTVEVTTVANNADQTGWTRPGSRLGVYLSPKDFKYPVKVKYGVENIGGPSAGMMFSLAIYDSLTPGSLGGDKAIAGTGTISMSGEVGPIGGIQHKLVGASQKGAKYFVAPAENCAETIGYEPEGMPVYAVRTFDEAVTAVKAIGDGKTSNLRTCRDIVNASKKK